MARRFETTEQDGIVSIQLPARVIDSLYIIELSNELLSMIEAEKPARLMIDFGQVERFSSEGIGLMLRANSRVKKYQGQLKLSQMPYKIREIFKLTRLDGDVLDIFDTTEDAVKSFA